MEIPRAEESANEYMRRAGFLFYDAEVTSELFLRWQRVLEHVFPVEWLVEEEKRDHLALRHWDLCDRMLEQGNVLKYPEQSEDLYEVARVAFICHILSTVTGGDAALAAAGTLDAYGEASARRKVVSRILDREQYEDLLIELYVDAWHRMKDHTVRPMEREGLPDLAVDIPGVASSVFIECKHLLTGSVNRLRASIKKANNQVKEATRQMGRGYGVAVLDISAPVARAGLDSDDRLHMAGEIVETVQQALAGKKNRSVGAAVVVWNDYWVRGVPPEPTLFVHRFKPHRVLHSDALLTIPSDLPLFQGYSIGFWLTWSQRNQRGELG